MPRSHTIARRTLIAVLAVLLLLAAVGTAAADQEVPQRRWSTGQMVDYPLVFPVGGNATTGSRSHFWDGRYNGIHHAQDIMAPKMTPVYTVADGVVTWVGTTCCSLIIDHDDGWVSHYIHLNNDTFGTDDGKGWGIAPGIVAGAHVTRGQLIGWVGDSGNAENVGSHLHYELEAPGNIYVDSFESLEEGEAARGYACAGTPATRVDTNGDHQIRGTLYDDVLVGTPEADHIDGRAGNDLVCGREGPDTLIGGRGDDELRGNEGRDVLDGGHEADLLLGGSGADILEGGTFSDELWGGGGNDLLDGGAGDDYLNGGIGDDVLRGGSGNDLLGGADGRDRLLGEKGDDVLVGGADRDRLFASPGNDSYNGGAGRDGVVFANATARVIVDLIEGTVSGGVTATLASIEVVDGSPFDDRITGDERPNVLRGLGGNDVVAGSPGDDRILGGTGDDTLRGEGGDDRLVGGGGVDSVDGGAGEDVCVGEDPVGCEK